MTLKVQIITNNIRFNEHDIREYADIESLQEHLDYLRYGENMKIKDVKAIEGFTFANIDQLEF